MSIDPCAIVTFSCPACGSLGYDAEFNATELRDGVQVSFPCDDCGAVIAVDAEVRVQILGGAR